MAATALVSLNSAAHCFDVQFHPSEPLLAVATISGEIELHHYDSAAGSAERRLSWAAHTESCRTARFLPTDAATSASAGARLASASADKSTVLSDIERGAQLWRAKLVAAGNALLPLDFHRFAVGDDDGHIRVYDVRQAKSVIRYAENEDFISDMALGSDGHSICATSGDGTLAVYDIRKSGDKGLVAMSDFQEDEYLSVAILKEGKKVVCGSQTGVLAVFTWGDFGDQKDRIKGHPMSVDAIVRLSEDRILTGSSDGDIRVVSVYDREHGNKVLGTLGEHGDGGYPLERLSLSADGKLVASASHGQPSIQIWPADVAQKFPIAGEAACDGAVCDADEDSDDSDEPRAARRKRRRKGGGKKALADQAQQRKAGSFFAGL